MSSLASLSPRLTGQRHRYNRCWREGRVIPLQPIVYVWSHVGGRPSSREEQKTLFKSPGAKFKHCKRSKECFLFCLLKSARLLQVPCWLRPRDRTRSPEVLNNASRPTTLPLRIPPRISITQADASRFARSVSSRFPPQPPLRPTVALVTLQLRSRKWPLTGSHPAGLAQSRPHPAHLPPGPEKRILPVPLRLRLRHVPQDRLAELVPRQRRVRKREKISQNQRMEEGVHVFSPVSQAHR